MSSKKGTIFVMSEDVDGVETAHTVRILEQLGHRVMLGATAPFDRFGDIDLVVVLADPQPSPDARASLVMWGACQQRPIVIAHRPNAPRHECFKTLETHENVSGYEVERFPHIAPLIAANMPAAEATAA